MLKNDPPIWSQLDISQSQSTLTHTRHDFGCLHESALQGTGCHMHLPVIPTNSQQDRLPAQSHGAALSDGQQGWRPWLRVVNPQHALLLPTKIGLLGLLIEPS